MPALAAPARGGFGSAATEPKPTAQPAPGPTKAPIIEIEEGIRTGPRRILIYGSGGIGKSSLLELLTAVDIKPLVIDLDRGSKHLNLTRVPKTGAPNLSYNDVRSILHDQSLLSNFGAVAIDSFTKAEEVATQWVIEHVKHEKGHKVERIEDYGFGKGFSHIYDAQLLILNDLDALIAAGKHVILIAHECTANVPNPMGEDFIRFEPRLQSPPSGKNSVRHRVKEWADDVLFIGYDIFANKEGKAAGSGTRTIYPQEMPTHWAKSRLLDQPIPYDKGSAELWEKLLGKEAK